MGTLSEFWE
uniref:Uncharacterized protein n=1 Tax=Anguilla anguilla TaxID=7936 RepID=A0A0E9V370_ANGAN